MQIANKKPLFLMGTWGVLFLIKAALIRPARMSSMFNLFDALRCVVVSTKAELGLGWAILA